MKKLLTFISLVSLFGCYSSFHPTVKNFTYCYNGQYTGIDTIVKIKGYYKLPYVYNDTFYHGVIFYKNGMYRIGFDSSYYHNQKMYKYIYNRGPGNWGIYYINDDTLKIQSVDSPGGMSWLKSESWFRILDSTTIQLLLSQTTRPITEADIEAHQKNKDRILYLPGQFIPFDNLPDPNKSWIMKRKWFWCDEEQFKSWKKNN